jgi:hypothetical protein
VTELSREHRCDLPQPFDLGRFYRCDDCGNIWREKRSRWVRMGWFARRFWDLDDRPEDQPGFRGNEMR